MANSNKNSSAETPAWILAIQHELLQIRAELSTNHTMLATFMDRPQTRLATHSSITQGPDYQMASSSTSRGSAHIGNRSQSASRPYNVRQASNQNSGTAGSSTGTVPKIRQNKRPNPNPVVEHKTPNGTKRQLINEIANRPAVPRPCWYHRQFGSSSVSCILPCSFAPPNNQVNPNLVNQDQPMVQAPLPVPAAIVIEQVPEPNAEISSAIQALQEASLSDSSDESDSDNWNHKK